MLYAIFLFISILSFLGICFMIFRKAPVLLSLQAVPRKHYLNKQAVFGATKNIGLKVKHNIVKSKVIEEKLTEGIKAGALKIKNIEPKNKSLHHVDKDNNYWNRIIEEKKDLKPAKKTRKKKQAQGSEVSNLE